MFTRGGDNNSVYLHGNPEANAVISMVIHCGRGKNSDGEMVVCGCSIMDYVRKFVQKQAGLPDHPSAEFISEHIRFASSQTAKFIF